MAKWVNHLISGLQFKKSQMANMQLKKDEQNLYFLLKSFAEVVRSISM